jgi:putative PEP-CTERM system TPR-repeat lipoprotein
VAALVAPVLGGCGGDDPPKLIASAKAYLAKGEYDAGIIQLKSALQKAPDNAEARFLLGESFLRTGSPAAAETELRKALDLHYPADQVYPALARALLEQSAFNKLITELGARKLDNPRAEADLKTTLAAAYLAVGDTKHAGEALAAAAVIVPNDARILVLEAQISAASNDLPKALSFVDAALAATPNYPDALILKAQLQSDQGHRDDAVKTLEQAVGANPNALNVRFALISMLVASGHAGKAVEHVDAMKKLAPRDLRTSYADALVSFVLGHTAHARDVIQQVLAAKPDNLQALYLSALIDAKFGSYATAEESFRKVVAQAPDQDGPREALAAIYLRTGRSSQAVEILEAALQRSPNNPTVLRMAAEADLALGNTARAAQYYERANALDQGNMASKIRLAQVRAATGDTNQAFKDLEALSAADSSQYQADLALIVAHLRRGQFDQALAAIATLEKKQPSNPLTYNVKGLAYAGMHDSKNARASFEKALEIQPTNAVAVHSLGLLDVQEQKPGDARKRYEQLLAKEPKNEQLLLGFAELLAIAGGTPDEIRVVIERAIAAAPESPNPRLVLVNYYASQRDFKSALAAAQSAEAAFPKSVQVLQTLGSAQRAAGQTSQAAETFARAAKLQPRNVGALLQLADAQAAGKDYDAAIATLHEAVASDPNQTQPWRALVDTYILAGRPEAAIAEARKLQKDYPDRAFGFALEGKVRGAEKKWTEAAAVYQQGIARQPIPLLAVWRYEALVNAGKAAEATQFAGQWMKQHPKDATFDSFLGEQSLSRKDTAGAIAHYRAALKIEPENTVYLNNVAFLLADTGDPAAREYAERAYRQAPFNPEVIDTLGWAYVQSGETAKGLELLREASSLAPGSAEIRLHYGKALLATGDKAGARRTLEPLTQLDKSSPQRGDAEKLLSGL